MSAPAVHTMLCRLGDTAMNRLIDMVERALNHLEAGPFVQVKILAPTVFPAAFPTFQRVYHGLGYIPTGYFAVKNVSFTVVSEDTVKEVADPSNFIRLGVNAPCTLTLAIF